MAFSEEVLAGPHTVRYAENGGSLASLGVIAEGGITLEYEYQVEDIKGDYLGETILNGIYVGGNLHMRFTLEEADNLQVMKMCHPFGVTAPGYDNQVGVPGTLASRYAGIIELTPVTNTETYLAGNVPHTLQVITASLVLLTNNHVVEKALKAGRMAVPIRLRCYPYVSNSINVFFTRSAAA